MIRPAFLVFPTPVGWSHVFQSYVFHQGRIQDLSLEGAKSSNEGARIEAPQAPRVYGGGAWRGGHRVSLPRKFFILGSQTAYFGTFSGPSRVFVSAA